LLVIHIEDCGDSARRAIDAKNLMLPPIATGRTAAPTAAVVTAKKP